MYDSGNYMYGLDILPLSIVLSPGFSGFLSLPKNITERRTDHAKLAQGVC